MAGSRWPEPTENNLKNVTAVVSARLFHLRDRRFGQRQIDAGRRHPAARALPAFLQFEGQAGNASGAPWARPARQGDRDRSKRDWPNAALESDHLHRRIHADPRVVQPTAGGARARLRRRAFQLQCQRRPLRELRRRRADQDRDALSAGRLCRMRSLPRTALQSRNARDHLQGKEHRRCA